MERMARLIASELEAQGLSQAEFARRTAVSTKHINRVLNGHQAATLPMLDYWAHVLGLRWSVSLQPLADETTQEALR